MESVYRNLKLTGGGEPEILCAIEEVTPAVFLSLLTITVIFLPIFALTGQEGRLFQPLAAAKTIVTATAALTSVTLAPALRILFTGRTSRAESRWQSSIRRKLTIYESALRLVLRFPKMTVACAVLVVVATTRSISGLAASSCRR